MIKFLLGFTVGALLATAALIWTAPRPTAAPLPAPGWYNPALILYYTGNFPAVAVS